MRTSTTRARRSAPLALLPLFALARGGTASAEGYEELGDQNLVGSVDGLIYTTAFVDIIDADVEFIVYTSTRSSASSGADSGNTLTVYGPDGSSIGSFSSGDTISPSAGAGPYRVTWASPEFNYWDLTVYDSGTGEPVGDGGRLWSYAWYFNAGSYEESAAFSGSFFAKVDAGDGLNSGVVEMLADGLAGYEWVAAANGYGLEAPYSGYGVDYGEYTDAAFIAGYPLYLSPPASATYTLTEPELSGESVFSEAGECDTLVPGVYSGGFRFTSSVDGTYRVVCDLDGDGVFDRSGASDLALSGEAVTGDNRVSWDGLDALGATPEPGTYDCALYVTAGEYHYVAADLETLYQGLRLFEVQGDGSRVGLDMFWNDTLVAAGTVSAMPAGEIPASDSGPAGVNAGAYDDPFDPDPSSDGYNARAWGSFETGSIGDGAYLDTYAFLSEGEGEVLSVPVVATDTDSDGDGVPDLQEDCLYGTDPIDPDGDDDGILDGDEIGDGEAPRDTDEDGTPDVADPDDDDDGVPTVEEGAGDTDGDGIPDYLDPVDDRPDSGDPDSGDPESGNPDSGSPDSGGSDSGDTDGAGTDSGDPDSAGTDSGHPDSKSPDSGAPSGESWFSGGCSCASVERGGRGAPWISLLLSLGLWRRRREAGAPTGTSARGALG